MASKESKAEAHQEKSDVAKWPNLYGPNYDSRSVELGLITEFGADGPQELWREKIGVGYSAPVVWGDRLVVISRYEDEEIIECRRAESGELVWSFPYPTDFECSFEYSNGPYATPVIHDDRVFAVSTKGEFFCLNLMTGDLVWKRNLLDEYGVKLKEWPVVTSPVLVDKKLIFNLGAVENQAGLIALRAEDGTTIWESTSDDFSHASPIFAEIQNKKFVFAVTDPGLVCINPSDGSEYWRIKHRIRQRDRYNAVSPIVYQNKVCVVTGPSVKPGFRCLEIQPDGSYLEPWKNIRLLNTQYTNLVVADNFLFGFTPVKQGGPELICIDLEKGKSAWKTRPDIGRGNLIAVENRLFILGEDGTLVVFELSGEKAVEVCRTAKPILEKPCYTSMALSNGLLYARNEKEVVCLNLRATRAQ